MGFARDAGVLHRSGVEVEIGRAPSDVTDSKAKPQRKTLESAPYVAGSMSISILKKNAQPPPSCFTYESLWIRFFIDVFDFVLWQKNTIEEI